MSVTPTTRRRKCASGPVAAHTGQNQRPFSTSRFCDNQRNPLLSQNLTHILGREFSLKTRLLGSGSDLCYQRCGRWLLLDIDGLCTRL
jgi:hypothetical protein